MVGGGRKKGTTVHKQSAMQPFFPREGRALHCSVVFCFFHPDPAHRFLAEHSEKPEQTVFLRYIHSRFPVRTIVATISWNKCVPHPFGSFLLSLFFRAPLLLLLSADVFDSDLFPFDWLFFLAPHCGEMGRGDEGPAGSHAR